MPKAADEAPGNNEDKDMNTKASNSSNSTGHDCNICHKKDMTLSGLKIHLLCHSGEKPFLCTVCDKRFTCSSNLKKHMRIHTKDYIYKCEVCGKSCSDPSNMKKHMTVHSKEKAYVCPSCGKSYSYAQSLRQHVDDVHVENGEKRLKSKRKGHFPCPECGKVFGFYWRCTLHQARVHAVERPFPCPECGKCFARETILNKHLQTHEKPFPCTHCEKRFSFRDQLRKHLRIHSGEKPFKCRECSRAFTQSGSLTEHMRTHTGSKPYACNICGMKFASSSSQRRHERKVKSCFPVPRGEEIEIPYVYTADAPRKIIYVSTPSIIPRVEMAPVTSRSSSREEDIPFDHVSMVIPSRNEHDVNTPRSADTRSLTSQSSSLEEEGMFLDQVSTSVPSANSYTTPNNPLTETETASMSFESSPLQGTSAISSRNAIQMSTSTSFFIQNGIRRSSSTNEANTLNTSQNKKRYETKESFPLEENVRSNQSPTKNGHDRMSRDFEIIPHVQTAPVTANSSQVRKLNSSSAVASPTKKIMKAKANGHMNFGNQVSKTSMPVTRDSSPQVSMVVKCDKNGKISVVPVTVQLVNGARISNGKPQFNISAVKPPAAIATPNNQPNPTLDKGRPLITKSIPVTTETAITTKTPGTMATTLTIATSGTHATTLTTTPVAMMTSDEDTSTSLLTVSNSQSNLSVPKSIALTTKGCHGYQSKPHLGTQAKERNIDKEHPETVKKAPSHPSTDMNGSGDHTLTISTAILEEQIGHAPDGNNNMVTSDITSNNLPIHDATTTKPSPTSNRPPVLRKPATNNGKLVSGGNYMEILYSSPY